MSSRDLTLAAIEGNAERVPFNPFIMHLAAALHGVDYSNTYCRDANTLAKAQIECADRFGIDHVCVSTDAYREASAWGVEIDFSGHTPIARKYLDIDSFNQCEAPDLASSKRIQDRIEAVHLLKERVGRTQCVIGWIEAPFAEACCLFGLMNVLKLARRTNWTELMKAILERVVPVQTEFAKMQIEAGADIIGAGDSAVSQIGPLRYEGICLKPIQRLFTDIKKLVPVLYHVCGNSAAVDKQGHDMLELIVKSGTSILDIDHQVDMNSAKAKVGNRVCIRGNTDTSLLGSPIYTRTEVSDAIANTIKAGKPGGRYMFGAGCEWPWSPLELAVENLEVARSLVEKHGVY